MSGAANNPEYWAHLKECARIVNRWPWWKKAAPKPKGRKG